MVRTLALLLAVPCAAAVQEDPFVTRVYNVEFITRSIQDFPGASLGLCRDGIGCMIAAETEFASTQISGDDLIDLICANVVEDSWEHVSAAIDFSGGVLTVTQRRSVHERIAQYLDYWRSFFGRMVALDAAVVTVDPAFLAELRAAGNADRPAVLAPEQAKKLLGAAREGKRAALVKSMRANAHPGQRINMQDITRKEFISDHDVLIATGSVVLAPVVDLLATGIVIDVRPYLEPFGNAVTLEVRIDRADPKKLEARKLRLPREIHRGGTAPSGGRKDPREPLPETRIDEPKVEYPVVASDRIRTTLTVRGGETAIVGSTFREGRNVLYLLTPVVVALEERKVPEPRFEEERLLKLYDVSPLTRGIMDWPGPRLELAARRASAGGALVGATFTLDEPAVRYDIEVIVEMIRTRVEPESWGNRRNDIDATGKGMLVIRQRPEALRKIDAFLDGLLSARARMITTEAFVIRMRKGARAAWERKIPAFGPGGYFVPEKDFAGLLKAALEGGDVRLIETGEVTCFPQQRAHATRLEQEVALSDYEPQIDKGSSQFDPVHIPYRSGFVLDVRPYFIRETERIGIDLRGALRNVSFRLNEEVSPGAGPLTSATGSGFGWQSTVICKKGFATLAGIETRGEEDVALFLRARANLLEE